MEGTIFSRLVAMASYYFLSNFSWPCPSNCPGHGTDNPLPIFTQTLHRSHLNKGCYGMLHTILKSNLVNFDIPNGFLYYGNPFGISKLTRLHFKGVCNIP